MAPIDAVVPQPSTSPRPPETPPGSSPCTPPNNIRVQGSPLVGTMDRFEQGMMKLIQALERVDTTTKLEDIESKPSNYTEAGKPKARASKIEYRRVDEVYVPCSTAAIVLTSPVKLGRCYIEVQDRKVGCAPRKGDGPGRACVCGSRSKR